MAGEIVEHKGLRIAVLRDGDKYVAWIECPERHLLRSGLSFAEKVGTHSYDSPDHALDAAVTAIDSGEVVVHPSGSKDQISRA